MRKSLTISAVMHAMALLWSLIAFAPKAFEKPADSVPVDIISASDFSRVVAGSRTAPKSPAPKPDPIAEALKKEQTKPEPKKEEAKVPTPPHRPDPPKPQAKYDPVRIAALLDKRDAQRQTSLGELINHTPTLGSPKGSAPTLSQNEIDALRAQIRRCWNPPAGAANAQDLRVEMNVKLRIDGSLAAQPVLLERGTTPYFQVFAESALRAVERCQPYSLPVAKYEVWKDIDLGFRLDDLYGG